MTKEDAEELLEALENIMDRRAALNRCPPSATKAIASIEDDLDWERKRALAVLEKLEVTVV